MALRNISLAALGGPAPSWKEEMWSALEQVAIDCLRDAFALMQGTKIVVTHLTENQISAELLRYIDSVRLESQLPLFPHDESRLLQARANQTVANPDEAPRIDLAFRHIGAPRAAYFGVEAKVVTRRSVGSRRPKKSIDDYVEEGLDRYRSGTYGEGLRSGAMLAYVIVGPVDEIVTEVNNRLPRTERLNLTSAGVCAVYISKHPRGTQSSIKIHHLMMDFHDSPS